MWSWQSLTPKTLFAFWMSSSPLMTLRYVNSDLLKTDSFFFSSTSLGTLIPHQILVPHIAFLFNTITWKAELLRWLNPDCLSIESWYSKERQGCVPSTQSRTVKASMCRCSFNPLSTAWIPCFLTVAPAAVLTPGFYHQIKNIPLLKYYLKCSDKWFNLPVKVRFWGPHFSRLRDTQALWGW